MSSGPAGDGRSIPFERWWNARDLGGLPTGDGESTRYGVLIRAATPEHATPADVRQARRLGLHAFVDLRMPGHPPDWRQREPRVTTVEADLVGGISRRPVGEVQPEDLLRFLLDAGGPGIARGIEAITDLAQRSLPVVFHCNTGKDRTGLIAVVILSLASVSEEAIVDDYLAANPGFEAMRSALAQPGGPDLMEGAPPAVRGPVVRPAAEGGLHYLAEVGGAAAYLEAAGLAPATIERAASLLR